MQKQRLRTTLVTASAFVMLASAAFAQEGGKEGGKVLTQTIPEEQARSVMKRGAIGAEKRLPALPAEFSQVPRPGPLELPDAVFGDNGGEAVEAVDVATDSGIEPKNYGCAQGGCGEGTNLNTIFHYNDHRIDPLVVVNYPYRTSGYFLHTFNGRNFFYCTATLISRSILVTAGHCVYDTDINQYIRAGTFYPACVNCNGGGTLVQPYGRATARYVNTTPQWRAATEATGLDQGYDVAVVTLNKRLPGSSVQIGNVTGWLGFCHTNCLQPYWQLSQIGYPGNYDGGNRMNYGEHIEQSDTRDYIHGSGMQGGSSGGPHVSNIGSLLDTAADKGRFVPRNWVFAVTSWGFNDESRKIQGASPLSGPGNINNFKNLYNSACRWARALHGAGSCALFP
jgi:V8-like Glu-specific endopeptidase